KDFSPASEHVECKLCGTAFKTISISHVKYRHHIDLDDYRERFPNAILTSEGTLQRISESVGAHYERRGQRWSPARVRDALRALRAQGKPVNARAVVLSHKALYEAAYSLFGSWDHVLEEAGIIPNDVRRRRNWSREGVLEEIRKRTDSGELFYGSRFCRRHPVLVSAASAVFGSWREALREAGLNPLASPKTDWTPRTVTSRIRERAQQGKSLHAGKVHREDSALWKAAKRLFREPWAILIRKLGYPYTGNDRWSRERIVKDILVLAVRGQDLLASGIYRSQKNLTSAAARQFGSWKSALAAAGIRIPLTAPGLEGHKEAHKMAHTSRDQEKLLIRARRIRVRIQALEKALVREDECSKILNLLAGSRVAMDRLMVEILEGHIRFHVADPDGATTTDRTRATEQLIAFVRGQFR
ncbi:MAG TPA: metal-sensing transcriptional repressor, partial [Planctomycetota bacterium]|nr:metal-sensing transcriptional repressor [Planctomycetota bacterium]